MKPVISIDEHVMHGVPCFAGTRVAVQTLFDHLEADYTIEGFLEQFPTVTREQVIELLEQVKSDIPRLAASATR